MQSRRNLLRASALVPLLASPTVKAFAQKRAKLTLGVAGISYVSYLPIMLAQALGAYEAAGLDVELINIKGGSGVLTALVAGTIDVSCGFFDHTIQLTARGRPIECIVLIGRLAGLALVVAPKFRDQVHSVKDLAGKRVGVTSPGSATDFTLKYLLRKNGVDPSTVSVIGLGDPGAFLAAVSQGQVAAILNGEPSISLITDRYPDATILMDTRTESGSSQMFDGGYTTSCLYSSKPWIDAHRDETTRLVGAVVATLDWMTKHTAEEAVAKLPKEVTGEDPTLYLQGFRNMHDFFSRDGIVPQKAVANDYELLKMSIPEIADAHIDLSSTYTNQFVEAARAKGLPTL